MGYSQITQEEAKRIMEQGQDFTIVDVRNPEEFIQGHIPNAINVPNPTISNKAIPELPDKDRTLLVYCRSGQRSRIAGKKLAVLGYKDVRDFGGILDWKYEIE